MWQFISGKYNSAKKEQSVSTVKSGESWVDFQLFECSPESVCLSALPSGRSVCEANQLQMWWAALNSDKQTVCPVLLQPSGEVL